jgi:hypothetical protein
LPLTLRRRRRGRVESNHHSTRRRGYNPLSSPMLSVRVEGDRPDSNRYREVHILGCSPLTPRPPRAGTTGLQSATSRLTSERSARLSYAPERGSAGGIRTHGLELMRLARTAAPLPRSLAGRSRTCDLRRPKPVGWPAPLQPEDERVPRRAGSSGGRTRTCVSRVTVARVAHCTTPESRTAAAGLNLPSGERPKTRPFSRRGTAPVAVLPRVAPAGVEPAPSRVRTGSSAG